MLALDLQALLGLGLTVELRHSDVRTHLACHMMPTKGRKAMGMRQGLGPEQQCLLLTASLWVVPAVPQLFGEVLLLRCVTTPRFLHLSFSDTFPELCLHLTSGPCSGCFSCSDTTNTMHVSLQHLVSGLPLSFVANLRLCDYPGNA